MAPRNKFLTRRQQARDKPQSSSETPKKDPPRPLYPRSNPIIPSIAFEMVSTRYDDIYKKMVSDLINLVSSEKHCGVVPFISTVGEDEGDGRRYYLVNMSSQDEERIRVLCDRRDMYICACASHDAVWYLQGEGLTEQLMRNVFPDHTEYKRLRFGGEYGQLEKNGDSNRATMPLGFEIVNEAINYLARVQPSHMNFANFVGKMKRCFLILVQFLSEGTRLRPLYEEFLHVAKPPFEMEVDTFVLKPFIVNCEGSWGYMSEQAHEKSSSTELLRDHPLFLNDGNEFEVRILIADGSFRTKIYKDGVSTVGDVHEIVQLMKSKNEGKVKVKGKLMKSKSKEKVKYKE